MIVGPVRRFETEEGTILVTVDGYDMKYLVWGCYERLTLAELEARGIHLTRAEETVELRWARENVPGTGLVPPAKR